MSTHNVFVPPAGTRDQYPTEMAKVRYIQDGWRRAAIRHGFDEVGGPTIEHADVYAHSGAGISGDLFTVKSGQTSPDSAPAFVLRAEFTPTLARMYAARSATLVTPVKWFSEHQCFRAERPQRGRLREFMQWDCDIIGDDSVRADAEVIGVAVDALRSLGLTPEHVKVRISHRGAVESLLRARGVPNDRLTEWFYLLDRAGKISNDDFTTDAVRLGMPASAAVDLLRLMALSTPFEAPTTQVMLSEDASGRGPEYFKALFAELKAGGVGDWCVLNLGIVRGLSYYSGMVFEVHGVSGKERAIAGGGRYDHLIEQLGGPPTPAVGFGMGEAVLGHVLEEHGLYPTDRVIGERLGLRPDVVLIAQSEEIDPVAVGQLVAQLRRAGLHVRRPDVVGSSDAVLANVMPGAMQARFAVTVESSDGLGRASVVNLDTAERHPETLTFAEIAGYIRG